MIVLLDDEVPHWAPIVKALAAVVSIVAVAGAVAGAMFTAVVEMFCAMPTPMMVPEEPAVRSRASPSNRHVWLVTPDGVVIALVAQIAVPATAP